LANGRKSSTCVTALHSKGAFFFVLLSRASIRSTIYVGEGTAKDRGSFFILGRERERTHVSWRDSHGRSQEGDLIHLGSPSASCILVFRFWGSDQRSRSYCHARAVAEGSNWPCAVRKGHFARYPNLWFLWVIGSYGLPVPESGVQL
jgi:hypothetical protein